MSRDPGVFLRTARFTAGYVRLVGQEPARSKCVLMSTSKLTRIDMRGWVLTDEGDKWTVKLDVGDVGGHLDTTFRAWCATLAAGVRLAVARLVLIFDYPLDFCGRLKVIRSMFIPGALHGIEASLLADASLRKLRIAIFEVIWTRRQPLAKVGAVLSLLDGPPCCDPVYCVVWFRFRVLRRYFAYRPGEVARVYCLLDSLAEGCPGHGLVHVLADSAAEIGFHWNSDRLGWERLGLPILSNLVGLVQHFRVAVLEAWRVRLLLIFVCVRGSVVARGRIFKVLCSSLTLTTFGLLKSALIGGIWNGFFLVRCEVIFSALVRMVMVIFSGIVLFLLKLGSVSILSFMV